MYPQQNQNPSKDVEMGSGRVLQLEAVWPEVGKVQPMVAQLCMQCQLAQGLDHASRLDLLSNLEEWPICFS